ncbi:SWIM zinc finger family protein [Streptomyces sp. NPDC048290]|uniref:SWIM zinc finger family protein n=1 Tax=Streptomyces sp. NPDC048290 TaxID=3155811 RepID=UPI0034190312
MPAEFGATPWGRAWVRTVESTVASAPNPALPKARSLARNHAVTLSVGTGSVEADVMVSGTGQPVRLQLPCWSDQERADAERLMAKALDEHRGLAVGDLPDSLEADLRRDGIGIAVPLDDLTAHCSCRVRRRPCVHVLATLYALSQRVDERPRLAVELRTSAWEPATPADPDWTPLAELGVADFYGT